MIWNLNNLKRYWEKNRDTSSCFNFIEKKSIKSENFWKLKDLQMKSVLNTKKKTFDIRWCIIEKEFLEDFEGVTILQLGDKIAATQVGETAIQ